MFITVTCEVCSAEVKTISIPDHLEWHEKIARATVMTANNMVIIDEYMKLLTRISEQVNTFAIANSAN